MKLIVLKCIIYKSNIVGNKTEYNGIRADRFDIFIREFTEIGNISNVFITIGEFSERTLVRVVPPYFPPIVRARSSLIIIINDFKLTFY